MINHLGIIMDGNRRWAKSKFLPSFEGHRAGAKNARDISRLCFEKNINYLTLWALSADNLEKRGEDEVKQIIKLINNIESYLGEMFENGIKFQTIGNIAKLPETSQEILEKIKEKTKANRKGVLTLALVYGGQDEILRATKKIIQAGLEPGQITKQEFKKYLDTANLPKIDMIVRTGGDTRHSGFLLFDSEYSEYYFSEKKWPEFDEEELEKVIESFSGAKRNFGK